MFCFVSNDALSPESVWVWSFHVSLGLRHPSESRVGGCYPVSKGLSQLGIWISHQPSRLVLLGHEGELEWKGYRGKAGFCSEPDVSGLEQWERELLKEAVPGKGGVSGMGEEALPPQTPLIRPASNRSYQPLPLGSWGDPGCGRRKTKVGFQKVLVGLSFHIQHIRDWTSSTRAAPK